MTLLGDDLTRTPIGRARVTLPGDASANLVQLGPLAPGGQGGVSRAIQWQGVGPATLWYIPAAKRTTYTASETAASIPNVRQAVPLYYSGTWEQQDVQATAIDVSSSTGVWSVVF